jgi:hypothetical protein
MRNMFNNYQYPAEEFSRNLPMITRALVAIFADLNGTANAPTDQSFNDLLSEINAKFEEYDAAENSEACFDIMVGLADSEREEVLPFLLSKYRQERYRSRAIISLSNLLDTIQVDLNTEEWLEVADGALASLTNIAIVSEQRACAELSLLCRINHPKVTTGFITSRFNIAGLYTRNGMIKSIITSQRPDKHQLLTTLSSVSDLRKSQRLIIEEALRSLEAAE